MTTRGRVLLVDDEPKELRSYARELGAAGFEVTEARGGTEAVHLLEGATFDVVLSDLVMPGMDGLTVLRLVRERTSDVPVILMSESANTQSVRRAVAEGVQCLVKPVDGGTFTRAAARAMRSRRARLMFRNRKGENLRVASFKATDVKNAFGRMLDTAIRQGAIVITKHDDPKAVLLSWDEFEALAAVRSRQLEALTGEFDALFSRMQTPAVRKGMRAAFDATPAQLGKAAVAAARKRG